METLELIDNYIDNQLSLQQVQQLEDNLQQDAELQQLLDSVVIARNAIRISALTHKVSGIHRQYIDEIRADQTNDNVRILPVTRAYPWLRRIAATLLIGMAGYGGYQVVSLDSAGLYQDKFISYQLPTTRGNAGSYLGLHSLYASGNYAGVLSKFTELQQKQPGDYFLTGIVCLKQNKYEQAIILFNTLKEDNKKRTERYFDQETDYYLALAYVGANRPDDAYPLFKAIHDTPHHLFRESVSTLDLIKISLLRANR